MKKEDVVDGKMLKPLTRQAVVTTSTSSSSSLCTTINRVVKTVLTILKITLGVLTE
ncbi:MAG TPA: hypothetical protein VE076_06540 [Nitrososphaeraceae archaeon]|nr:hypothetical protein [Nitrososphaeraceae archaeon]